MDYREEFKDHPDVIALIEQGIASGACVNPNINLETVKKIKKIHNRYIFRQNLKAGAIACLILFLATGALAIAATILHK